MRHSKRQRILDLAAKADVKVTPALVGQILATLAPAALEGLPQPVEPIKPRTPDWIEAVDQPLSNAARAALQDRIQAPHRPGGRIKPRPRWSADECPWGGWDDGSTAIVRLTPEQMEARREDKQIARLMALARAQR